MSDMKMLKILDENGNCKESMVSKITPELMKKMYEMMILTRIFDEIALKLQREGRLLTYASSRGQEAAAVGSALALQQEDWIFPSFREHGAFFVKGMPIDQYLQYWAGDERGMKIPENVNCFTVSIPVGTQTSHAVGAALAFKLRKEKKVSLVYFGDGGTSKGDFHEAMNFAGVFQVPVVFLCQNNQWAISLPRKKQTASETLAQKAFAYGFEGVLVDGNDVFSVFMSTLEAAKRAREGKGPTMIEAYTYRMSDHTTADESSKYRDVKEVEEWKKKDPIDRLRKYLKQKKIWNEEYEKKVLADASKKIEDAVKNMESKPPAKPEEIFDYLFEKKDWRQIEEQEEVKNVQS